VAALVVLKPAGQVVVVKGVPVCVCAGFGVGWMEGGAEEGYTSTQTTWGRINDRVGME
jgi:hypothetical protein